VVPSGICACPVMAFPCYSIAAKILTCPSSAPRRHLPSIAIAVSSTSGLRQDLEPAADQVVQEVRADGLAQGPDPGVAGAMIRRI
jgi:hypothetical protein